MQTKASMFFMIALIIVGTMFIVSNNQRIVEQDGFQMGTVIQQRVYGKKVKRAIDEVSARIAEIETMMTINAPGGEINMLNATAGEGNVKLSPETMCVIEKSIEFSELSAGAFDITVGPLVKAWGISSETPRVPSNEEIIRLLTLVNYKDIFIDKNQSCVKLAKHGQVVDVGAIAKGYAGDEAIRIYKANGISSGYINIGGNVVVLGDNIDGEPWRIAIRNPIEANGQYLGAVSVRNQAVVTSGDYERYFEKDGKRYHHIIDPKTGYPADSGLISVTIVAQSSTVADALSTSVFVMGLDDGMKLVDSIKGIGAIFVTKDKKVYVNQQLKGNFIFNEHIEGFEYIE